MDRRDVIKLIAWSVLGWPGAAVAQERERVRRVGVLLSATPDDPDFQAWLGAFLQSLALSGWTLGKNIRVDTRWSGGEAGQTRKYVTELLALSPDVVLAHGASTIAALLQATRTVPVVFPIVADPVGSGFVESLSRPGGNATGFMTAEFSIGSKWLELLKEIAPRITRVGVLRDPTQGSGTAQFAAMQAVSGSLGIAVSPINMGDASEIERNVAAFARVSNGGLIQTAGPGATRHRDLIVALAARYKLPTMFYERFFVAGGGLMSYGTDFFDQYRRAAGYVDRILKGEKPAELPVQAPTSYRLTINLKTAKSLGLEVPTALLARADELIE